MLVKAHIFCVVLTVTRSVSEAACVSQLNLARSQSRCPSVSVSQSQRYRMLTGIRPDPLHGFIRKGPGYCSLIEGGRNLHVSDFSMPPELRKYWGFSMTGIFVIPMITASGPISEDDGVLLPLET